MGVNRVYLTEAGARIAMYCQHNDRAIDFTKFGVGDGENLNPETAVAMTHEVTTFNVNRVKAIGGNNYRVSGDMPNTALSADLTYRELCLYAVDPETDSEVMYCYGNAKGADFDFTETIPAFDTSSAYSSRKFEIDLFLENDKGANVTIAVEGADASLITDLSNDYEELRHELDVKANTTAVEEMIRNVNTLKTAGDNGWTTETDTVANWAEKGCCVWWFNSGGQLNGQASSYGLLANYVRGQDVHQIWLPQGNDSNGEILHRSGNKSTVLSEWRKVFDSNSIIPKANGGTGNALGLASGLEIAGSNDWGLDTDTVDNWLEKGSCVWWFDEDEQLKNQLSTYGLLVSYVHENDVHQLWLPQPNGALCRRSGNRGMEWGEWVKTIDTDNIGQYAGMPTQLKTAGLNGFTHDTDTPENWIKKGNCVWFFNEYGNMENQPSNYGLLVNLMEKPDGQDVHQIWLTQSGGEMYHRGGGAGGFEPWRKVIDDKNIGEYLNSSNEEPKSLDLLFIETLEDWV